MNYDDKWLQAKMEELSLKRFEKPFLHQAYFNSRLQTTGGLYLHETHNIEINPKIIEKYDEQELIGVMVHELCHYHLHLEGKGYKHRDRDFKELLQKTGGLRYVKRLKDYKYHYICKNCGQDYYRYRKINLAKYCCGKCRSELKLEEKFYD